MALRGIKVIELSGLAPAPFCGMILADFGASVIRVDKVKSAADSLDVLANGKQSVAINLKAKEGTNILRKLAKTSDILLEPYRSGVMESLGLGPDALLKENPRLIYARMTGFGQHGYYSQRAGHDINYISISGLLSMFGGHKEKPLPPVNYAADFGGGGLVCALGIVMALFERASSGKGQVIDSNMVEGSAYVGSWLYRSRSLPFWGQERGLNVLDGGAHFYNTYETKDGKYVGVGAIEQQFYAELLDGLGLNENDVPQFDFENGKKIFTEKFLEKTQEEWSQIFDSKDACVTPVLSHTEAAKHKHNLERKAFVQSVDGKEFPVPAPRLSRTPGDSNATRSAPRTGEHTLNILKELSYSEEEIRELEKNGVIGIFNNSKL